MRSRDRGYPRRPQNHHRKDRTSQNPTGQSEGQRAACSPRGEGAPPSPGNKLLMTQIIPVAPVLDSLKDSVLSRVEPQVDEHCPPALGGGAQHPPTSGEDKSGTIAATLHQGKQVSTTASPSRDYEMPPWFQRERKPFFCFFFSPQTSLHLLRLAQQCLAGRWGPNSASWHTCLTHLNMLLPPASLCPCTTLPTREWALPPLGPHDLLPPFI